MIGSILIALGLVYIAYGLSLNYRPPKKRRQKVLMWETNFEDLPEALRKKIIAYIEEHERASAEVDAIEEARNK